MQRRSVRIAALMMAAFLCCAIFGQVSSTELQRPTQSDAAADKGAGPKVAISLPTPIDPLQTQYYCELLKLAEPQRVHFNRLLVEYQAAFAKVISQAMPEIEELSATSGALFAKRDYSAQCVAAYAELCDKLEQIRVSLVECDNRFLGSVQSILSEEQLKSFDRVRWDRERSRCSTFDKQVRGSRIDLTALVREIACSMEGLADIDDVLQQYEREVTPVFTKCDESIRSNALRLVEISHRQRWDINGTEYEPNTPQATAAQATARTDRLEMLAERARLQDQIVEINDQALTVLMTRLGGVCAEEFQSRYRVLAYPLVYPFNEDTADPVRRTATIDGVPAEVGQLILAAVNEYSRRINELNTQMCDESVDWRRRMAATSTAVNYPAYRERMRSLRDERWKVTAKLLEQVQSYVPASALPAVEPILHASKQQLAYAERAARNDNYPGP